MKSVEFYYDLVSPYSYLAYGRVGRICEENGAELVLRPMLLGAVHKAVGLQAPIEIRPKASYQARDIRRWAEYYGLPLEFPDPFPFRTLKTMRAAMFLQERGRAGGVHQGGFRALLGGGWRAGRSPGNRRGLPRSPR